MQTASRLPMSVGVAPGTTTMRLAGPATETVGCENPARIAQQRAALYPPGKFVAGVQTAVATMTDAGNRIRTVLDPYGSIEALRGGLGRVFKRKSHVFREDNLGIVLAPYGDRSPYPSSEIVSATKDYGPGVYCTNRPSRGPGYRWQETSAYEPDGSLGGLGNSPTDLQLATQYGYTPVSGQWLPGKNGAWSSLPWVPPSGAPSAAPQNQGIMTRLAGVVAHRTQRLGDAADDAGVVTADPATATLQELQRHQDRMYMLGIVSAAAVASTALINVFRYSSEKKDRRRYGKTAAEPNAMISGARRRRRRR